MPAIPGIIPPGPIGLVVMPNPFARPMFVMLPPEAMLIPTDFAASFDPVEFSGESTSMLSIALTLLLCRRCRFGATATLVRGILDAAAPGPGVAFGGAAAMGTTPFPPLIPVAPTDDPAEPWYEVGVLPAVLPPLPADPETEGGLWDSLTLRARILVGVVAWVVGAVLVAGVTIEFFLVVGPLIVCKAPIFFEARVAAPPDPPMGREAPDPRFRFLITSVFKERGRTTPWSFKKRPQALQRGWPSGFRLQSGVVWVKQFVQVVGTPFSPWAPAAPARFVVEPCFDPPGEEGRLGATEENPDMFPASGGELGLEGPISKGFAALPITFGVDAVRGIFPCRLSLPFLDRLSETDCADAWLRPKDPPDPSQSSGEETISVVVPPIVTCFLGGPPG